MCGKTKRQWIVDILIFGAWFLYTAFVFILASTGVLSNTALFILWLGGIIGLFVVNWRKALRRTRCRVVLAKSEREAAEKAQGDDGSGTD